MKSDNSGIESGDSADLIVPDGKDEMEATDLEREYLYAIR